MQCWDPPAGSPAERSLQVARGGRRAGFSPVAVAAVSVGVHSSVHAPNWEMNPPFFWIKQAHTRLWTGQARGWRQHRSPRRRGGAGLP